MKSFIKKYQKILLVLLWFLFISATFVLYLLDNELQTPYSTGIVSFELAKDLSSSEAIVNAWNTRAKTFAGISLGFDFLYIFIYTFLLSMLLYLRISKYNTRHFMYKAGHILIFAVFFAGIFDIIENIALIKLLTGHRQAIWSSVAYMSAVLKFGLISLSVLFILGSLINAFFKRKKWS